MTNKELDIRAATGLSRHVSKNWAKFASIRAVRRCGKTMAIRQENLSP
jgi:hypothetical protein